MQFMEFVEAICRAIEKSSPAPPIRADADSEEEEEMSIPDRRAQSLRDKIQNAIPLLANNCQAWYDKYFKQLMMC